MHHLPARPLRALLRRAPLLLAGGLVLLAFSPARFTYEADDTVHRSEEHAFRVDTFATGLSTPWGLAFLPDGRLLVTEKEGLLRIVTAEGRVSEPLEGVPAVRHKGQGGLLDVAVHPRFSENGFIYLSYSDPHPDKDAGFTALMRARLEGNRLVDQKVIFQAPREVYTDRSVHFGSRIVFDREGYLYFSIGDRGQQDNAQQVEVPNGKIHRLHDDGRIPADNPFASQPGAVRSIWSYGHRNPQGMALDPRTGELWATEHGPKGGDELNRVRKGLNYGWPVITYGINYNDTPVSDITAKEGLEQPALHWTPSIAVSAIDFYEQDAFPNWKNDLFVASLKFMQLRRIELDGGTVQHQEVVYEPGARIRDLETGPDGALYLVLEGFGTIVRLVPATTAG